MLCIIQARMSSERLPGKVLLEIDGRALLGRVIDQVGKARSISKVIIATSSDPSDQKIKDFCLKENIKCHAGSLEDVASRFLEISLEHKKSPFVRISGDSPLIDPQIIEQAIDRFYLIPCDIVTNVFPRTFPKGQSVEIINPESFIKAYSMITSKEQKEHVTKVFYENVNEFKIENFTSDGDYSNYNFCVDTSMDLQEINELIKHIPNDKFSWKELIQLKGQAK